MIAITKLQVRNKPMPVRREAESEMSLANRELERYQAMTERERLEFNMERAKDPAVSQGGPSSNKKPRMMGLGGKNLLQIYMERLERYVPLFIYFHYLIFNIQGRLTRNTWNSLEGEIWERLPSFTLGWRRRRKLCDPAFFMALFDI